MNSRSAHFQIRDQIAGARNEFLGVRIMSDETSGSSAIRDYLLGNLPESEAEEIERSYFANGQKVDEVWVEFGAIAEEYLCADLPEIESRRFEQRLKSLPALREMFENEKALFDYAARITRGDSRQVEPGASIEGAGWKWRLPAVFFKPPRLITASVVALIALAGLITWYALRAREGAIPGGGGEPQNGSQQADAQPQKSPGGIAQPSVAPKPQLKSGRDPNNKPITFLLLAAGTRGEQGDPPVLAIPARQDSFLLKLELPNDDCSEFSAVLRTESNQALQRWGKMRARREPSTLRVTSLRVRADSLKNAGYVIGLDCVSPHKNPVSAGEYRFKLERK